MDDVNMSNLICEEDIIQELNLFNIKFEDKEVLSQIKKICLVYDHSAEKLVGEWIGFCSKKEWLTDLNLTKVELFENEKFRQEQIKFENLSEGKETQFKSDKPNIQLDIDMLNDYGIVITDEEMMNSNKEDKVEEANKETDSNQQENVEKINGRNPEPDVQTNIQSDVQTNVQKNQQVLRTNDHNVQITNNTVNSTEKNGIINGTTNGLNKKDIQSNYILENRLNESVELGEKTIQNHFGDLMTTQQWINNDKTNPHKIQPLNPELHITKAFKTTQIKIHECNDILNEMIDDMFEFIKDKLGDELESLGDSFYVGRVNIDVKNNKDKVLTFESLRSFSQRKLKLDLSKIPTYSLFPGKIICFVGELQSDKIIVNKLYDDELLISSFSKQPIKLPSPINIMVASGPVSPTNSDDLSSLEHLLDQVKIFQPHYLILLGPFFDCRNDYLLFNCNGESFFNKIMKFISLSLENIITEAIIVPSTFDLNNYNIFPAPPFEHLFAKIRFMPNPSFLNLNGIVISITSVDIIRHIIRDEVKNNSNDQERICEHLLTQKNLYPLIPPNQEVNLEYSKLDFIKFNVRPHLFIIPSMIKNFVKNVHGTLFLNPEYLSKGVYSKIRIDIPPKDYTGSIDRFTKIEIVKNKSK